MKNMMFLSTFYPFPLPRVLQRLLIISIKYFSDTTNREHRPIYLNPMLNFITPSNFHIGSEQ